MIKYQGEKQIKAIRDKEPIKSIEEFNDSPTVLKEKEIYNKLTEKSFKKINSLDKKVSDKLVFKYKGNTADEYFSRFNNAFVNNMLFMNKIKDGEISLNEAKDERTKLRSKIGEIRKVQKRYLSKELESKNKY